MNWVLVAEDGSILMQDNGDFFLANIVESDASGAAGGGMEFGSGKGQREHRERIRKQLDRAMIVEERRLNGEPFPDLEDGEREYLLSLAYEPAWIPDSESIAQLQALPAAITEAQQIRQMAERMKLEAARAINMKRDEDDVIGLLI